MGWGTKVWQSEDNLGKSVLSFYRVNSRDLSWVIRLGAIPSAL